MERVDNRTVRGPRPEDRVAWTAIVNENIEVTNYGYDGRPYPICLRPASLEFTLHAITQDEAEQVLDLINATRGGKIAPTSVPQQAQPEPPRNRFEGLDL